MSRFPAGGEGDVDLLPKGGRGSGDDLPAGKVCADGQDPARHISAPSSGRIFLEKCVHGILRGDRRRAGS